MQGHERRTAKRYVIGDLVVEIDGVKHETLDVSRCAVAVVKNAGVNYAKFSGPLQFCSTTKSALNQSISRMHFITQRAGLVVLGYETDSPYWERTLEACDVRADMVPLEDVFG